MPYITEYTLPSLDIKKSHKNHSGYKKVTSYSFPIPQFIENMIQTQISHHLLK